MKVVTITGGQMNSIQTGELVFIDFYSQETYKYIFNVKIIEFCDFFMKLSVVNSKNKKIPDTLVNSEDYSSVITSYSIHYTKLYDCRSRGSFWVFSK